MTTTDPRAAAIEAAARATHNIRCAPCDHPSKVDRGIARVAVAAAVPHLTVGLRALHYRDSEESLDGEWCAACGSDWPCPTTEALDALERGGDRG